MNRKDTLMRVIAALLALAPLAAHAGDLQVKGQAKWVSEAPVEKIIGTAEGVGALTVDLADLTTIKGTLTFDVASMKTGNEMRDEHLKGEQWLDAAKHPQISFAVGAVKVTSPTKGDAVKEAELEVSGKFTLHGVTTDLTAPATIKWKGDKVKISTTFVVKLAEYQIKGKEGVVGSKVGESITIETTLKGVLK